MAEERRGAAPAGAPEIKVVDRRRFGPEGEPIAEDDRAPEGAPSAGAGAAADEPESRAETVAAQAKRIDELTRAYAALVEDNKSFRARLEREKERVVGAERAAVAQALLEAADDLERALAAVSGADAQGAATRTLADGVRLSLGALHKRIAELGAQRIPVVGERFDPRVAEAVDTVAVADEARDEVVVQEVRAGYRIGDRILRPARVRVGRLARA
jgi:molecular chaperone GrpE